MATTNVDRHHDPGLLEQLRSASSSSQQTDPPCRGGCFPEARVALQLLRPTAVPREMARIGARLSPGKAGDRIAASLAQARRVLARPAWLRERVGTPDVPAHEAWDCELRAIMYWEAALSSAIEVGIAIVGFSGIVIVLGRRDQGDWSTLERVRLKSLLGSSIAAVFASFLPFVLLSAGLSLKFTWHAASALLGIGFALVGAVRYRQFRGTGSAISVQESATFVLVAVVVLLLVANAAALGAAWPYVVAVLANLGIGLGQFVRLLLGFRPDSAA